MDTLSMIHQSLKNETRVEVHRWICHILPSLQISVLCLTYGVKFVTRIYMNN
uniref:Uncharacterized protein n=1 Tax=Brassica oleracea var. oleracea TaxID=109376 RepID=A0A0D3CXN3_BRAOL